MFTFTTTSHISNNTTIKNLTFSTCSFPNAIYFIHQMLYLSYVNKTKNQNQPSFIISVLNRRILNNHLQSPEPESETLETGECLITQVYKKLVSGHLQFFYKQTTGQGRDAHGKACLELTRNCYAGHSLKGLHRRWIYFLMLSKSSN